MYWKIRPRGPRAEGGVFSKSSQLEAVYCHSFFPERKCIGNYTSNSRGVLTVYKFNTLPLTRSLKKNDISLCSGHVFVDYSSVIIPTVSSDLLHLLHH